MGWDFDAESSVTMVRPSKSKELEVEPVENHIPNHHGDSSSDILGERGVDKTAEEDGERDPGTPVMETPPQLGIDDTAFVSYMASPGQRTSIVSTGEGEEREGGAGKRGSVVSVEGSSGLVVVSVCD